MRKIPPEPASPPLMSLIDIAFLVLIFFMCLPFKRLDHKLEAHLPTGRGIEQVFNDPPDEVDIRILDEGIRLGQHVLARPKDLTPLLVRLGGHSHYQIHSGPGVAWERVVQVVDVFAGLKYRHVSFRGVKAPGERTRRSLRLPRPK